MLWEHWPPSPQEPSPSLAREQYWAICPKKVWSTNELYAIQGGSMAHSIPSISWSQANEPTTFILPSPSQVLCIFVWGFLYNTCQYWAGPEDTCLLATGSPVWSVDFLFRLGLLYIVKWDMVQKQIPRRVVYGWLLATWCPLTPSFPTSTMQQRKS